MSIQAPLDHAALTRLAPQQLVSHRHRRFQGDTISVSLAQFVDADQHKLRRAYQALLYVLSVVQQHKDRGPGGWPMVQAALAHVTWKDVVRDMQQFGKATLDAHNSSLLEAVIHDLKGGSFVSLVVNLQLLEMGIASATDVLRVFFLTRDHLKMMRNAVPDLDRGLYERDVVRRAHHIELLVEKWSQASHKLQGAAAQVVVDCQYTGNISERCIEFAALDRVLYNLINNAARHAADKHIYLSVFPLGAQPQQDVRFVIYNRILSEHRQALQARFGDQLSMLFKGGFTTGGSGLGMRICADFVADAYGVRSIERCLEEHYVGAQCIDEYFVTWFHWPVVAD